MQTLDKSKSAIRSHNGLHFAISYPYVYNVTITTREFNHFWKLDSAMVVNETQIMFHISYLLNKLNYINMQTSNTI